MNRVGKCKKCGKCCQVRYLMRGMPLQMKLILCVMKPLLIWGWITNGKCHFLKKTDDGWKCQQYDKRPYFCREFPANENDLVDKGCGYKFVDK